MQCVNTSIITPPHRLLSPPLSWDKAGLQIMQRHACVISLNNYSSKLHNLPQWIRVTNHNDEFNTKGHNRFQRKHGLNCDNTLEKSSLYEAHFVLRNVEPGGWVTVTWPELSAILITRLPMRVNIFLTSQCFCVGYVASHWDNSNFLLVIFCF